MFDNILTVEASKILKRLRIDDLIKLDLSPRVLSDVFEIPLKENVESWFANYVLKHNSGFIYIPGNIKIFMNNLPDHPALKNVKEDGSSSEEFISLSQMEPALEPGFYKMRSVRNGFDLVKAGNVFISGHGGTKSCTSDNDEWTTSYKARGFKIQKQEMSNQRNVWKLPLLGELHFATLYIRVWCGEYIWRFH